MQNIWLSATIITLNEEKDLNACLTSLKGWVDEIVIVDCGSKDKTLEIAAKFGSKIFTREFDNFASQKNFAAKKTMGEWILSVDADEVIEKELAAEIVEAVKSNRYYGYSIPRKNIILGRIIKHARWDAELDRHVWLWKKNQGKWIGDVHEEVVVKGNVGKLKNAKIHNQYETVPEFFDMVNRYSEFEAQILLKKGKKFSYPTLFFQTIYNFLVRFVYRLGFLDGWRGFVLSYLMAIYHFIVWVKVWAEQNEK